MTVMLFLLTAGVVLAVVTGLTWRQAMRYRVVYGRRKSRSEAIDALVRDLEGARSSILVVCDECDAHSDKDKARIAGAVRAARDRAEKAGREFHVEFVWGRGRLIPDFIRALEDEHVIEVHRAAGKLPFTGRIIDGEVVEIHRSGSDIAPKKFWRASHTAPGIAERLTDAASAA